MPGKMSANIRGVPELRRRLDRLVMPKASHLYRRAGRRCGLAVVEVARPITPRRSGRLRESIRLGKSKRVKTTYVVADPRVAVNPRSKSRKTYATAIHFGWPGHNIEPNPFLERGLKRARPRFAPIWVQELDRELDKGPFL